MTQTQKILIVDDQEKNLYSLSNLLKRTGAHIIPAQSGDQALRASLHHDFALAILDVQMPEMDGYELAELLRGAEKTRNLPILFLTAIFSEDHQVFKGYESGGVDFIVKPFNPDILLNKVNVFLNLHRQKQELEEAKAALEAAHDALEERVRVRTLELEEANRALEAEIIERREAEEKLKLYTGKLEMKNQELQDFAFVASHDLQEPLRKIQVFGERLASRYQAALDETGVDYLMRMQNAARRMQDLIRGLLSYSRVTTNGDPFQPVDLNRLVSDILSDLQVAIERAGAVVETGALAVIQADPSQMRQLFQNLIGNALKFNNGSPPRVNISGGPVQEEGASQMKNKTLYRIRVEDNGIGFEEKYAQQIFTPFQRLHGRDEYEGTGMGLAICRKIVDRHNGRISVRSTPGRGTVFSVFLPVHQPLSETV